MNDNYDFETNIRNKLCFALLLLLNRKIVKNKYYDINSLYF
jgi:hypothetical protein